MKTAKLYGTNVHHGSLILVNPDWPLKEEPREDSLIATQDGKDPVLMERQAAKMLEKTLTAVRSGNGIVAISGYRTLRQQQKLYDKSLKNNGEEFTRQYVALPGCSEHQTGLAVDLAENKAPIDLIRPCFPYTGVCQRFRKKAADYGLIERYPKGRETVTQIAHEPWHFRYVGYPHSRIIADNGWTLEEYTDYLRQFVYGCNRLEFSDSGLRCEIGFLPLRPEAATEIDIPENMAYQFSGNNADGVVVTLWGLR